MADELKLITTQDSTNESTSNDITEFYEYVEGFKGETLSVQDRLNELLKIHEWLLKLEFNNIYHFIAVGYDPTQKSLLKQASKMEGYIAQNYFLNKYGYEYERPVMQIFCQAKVFIIKYFIDNYKNISREDIYRRIIAINTIKDHFKFLENNPNVKIYSDLVFQMLVASTLGKLYILTERYDEAAGSLMNASFIYGVLQERYAPLPQDKIDEFVNDTISKENSKKANEKWKEHNQQTKELKQKYLKIMRQDGHTSIAAAVDYIFAHDNAEGKKYRWIYNKLSEAIKEE